MNSPAPSHLTGTPFQRSPAGSRAHHGRTMFHHTLPWTPHLSGETPFSQLSQQASPWKAASRGAEPYLMRLNFPACVHGPLGSPLHVPRVCRGWMKATAGQSWAVPHEGSSMAPAAKYSLSSLSLRRFSRCSLNHYHLLPVLMSATQWPRVRSCPAPGRVRITLTPPSLLQGASTPCFSILLLEQDCVLNIRGGC